MQTTVNNLHRAVFLPQDWPATATRLTTGLHVNVINLEIKPLICIFHLHTPPYSKRDLCSLVAQVHIVTSTGTITEVPKIWTPPYSEAGIPMVLP